MEPVSISSFWLDSVPTEVRHECLRQQHTAIGLLTVFKQSCHGAADRHTTQYFEMFGNRGIYHEGWLARTVHQIPWQGKPLRPLEEDIWELYNVEEDFSLTNDLAQTNPEKMKELRQLFVLEALANNVFPIDDRLYERFNARIAGRPDLMGDRKSLTLAHGMEGILENTFLNVKNTSKTIEADVSLNDKANGVILCQGGKFGGWALYMNEGKPAYTYNWFGLDQYTIEGPEVLDGEKANIKLTFDYDGNGTGKGGVAKLFVDGEMVAEGRVEKTQPAVFSADETADVGVDDATQVVSNLFKSRKDSEFTGNVDKVTITIPDSE